MYVGIVRVGDGAALCSFAVQGSFYPTRLAFGVLTFSQGIGWSWAGGQFPQQRRLVTPAPVAASPQTAF